MQNINLFPGFWTDSCRSPIKPLQTIIISIQHQYGAPTFILWSSVRCQTVVITPWSHCSSISSGGSGVNRVNQHNPAELPFDKTFLLFLSSFYSRKLWASSWHLHTSAVSVNRVPAWVRFVLTDPPSSTRVLMCSWQRADRCFLISIPPTGPWINESAFILPRNISPFSFVCDCLFDVCERRRPRRIDFDSTVFDCGVQSPALNSLPEKM